MADTPEKKPAKPVSKSHLVLAALLTLAGQAGTGLVGTEKATKEISENTAAEVQKVQAQILELRLQNEREYAKKVDMENIDRKLDQANVSLNSLTSQVSEIRGYMKAKQRFGALESEEIHASSH